MVRTINEADWKLLRRVHPMALERFCQRVLSEVVHLAAEADQGAHERYVELFRLLRRRDKELAAAFNDLRRSTALLRLACMKSLDVLDPDEWARFSPETREAVRLLIGP